MPAVDCCLTQWKRTLLRHSYQSGAESEFVPEPDPSKPLLAHVVKVSIDPFRGRMGVVRIHQGVLKAGAQVYVDAERKPTKVAHITNYKAASKLKWTKPLLVTYARYLEWKINLQLRTARVSG